MSTPKECTCQAKGATLAILKGKRAKLTYTALGQLVFAQEKDEKESVSIGLTQYWVSIPDPKKKTVVLSNPHDPESEIKISFNSEGETAEWHDVFRKEIAYGANKYFGVDLHTVCKGALAIPRAITEIVTELESQLSTDGIFRLSGSKTAIEMIKRTYDIGGVPDLKSEDVHTVTGTFKAFYRDLPDPLCTLGLYDDFVEAANTRDPIMRLRASVASLPVVNQVNLKYLISFLIKVGTHSDENKMTHSNLAICIGPNIFRNNKDSTETVQDSGALLKTTVIMLDNFDAIFSGVPDPVPLPVDEPKPVTNAPSNQPPGIPAPLVESLPPPLITSAPPVMTSPPQPRSEETPPETAPSDNNPPPVKAKRPVSMMGKVPLFGMGGVPKFPLNPVGDKPPPEKPEKPMQTEKPTQPEKPEITPPTTPTATDPVQLPMPIISPAPLQHSLSGTNLTASTGGGPPPQTKPKPKKSEDDDAHFSEEDKAWKKTTHTDGRVYYYNEITSNTSWTKPQAMIDFQEHKKQVKQRRTAAKSVLPSPSGGSLSRSESFKLPQQLTSSNNDRLIRELSSERLGLSSSKEQTTETSLADRVTALEAQVLEQKKMIDQLFKMLNKG